MKSCVIFSCTVFSLDRIHVLNEFIDTFKNHFSDCDFYIGVNYGSIPEVEEVLRESKLNIKVGRVLDPMYYTESDAGAYQAALKLLWESNQRYDSYWFVHTKGAVNTYSDYLRYWYIENYLKNRIEVDEIINKGVGSYGMLAVHTPPGHYNPFPDVEVPLFENVITSEFPFPKIEYFYIHTLYTIGRKPMDVFLDTITSGFFNTKLNRYYFEGVFPYLVCRTGHYPYINNIIDCNGVDLMPEIRRWISVNNLESLNEHLSLPVRRYDFAQQSPPLLLC